MNQCGCKPSPCKGNDMSVRRHEIRKTLPYEGNDAAPVDRVLATSMIIAFESVLRGIDHAIATGRKPRVGPGDEVSVPIPSSLIPEPTANEPLTTNLDLTVQFVIDKITSQGWNGARVTLGEFAKAVSPISVESCNAFITARVPLDPKDTLEQPL